VGELLKTVVGGFPEAARGRLAIEGGGFRAALPPEAAKMALTALVRNALEASGEGQPVVVGAQRTGAGVRFAVVDQGCGMSPETLNRIAEPFFTTKEPGRGMGLGTFLARSFAERLGGSLVFESEVGKGTRALLELP